MRRLLLSLIICCLFVPAVAAQDQTQPPQAAEDMRQLLFNAQVALMGADSAGATQATTQARELYAQVISPHFAAVTPQADQQITSLLDRMDAAIQTEDVATLAATRSQVWTTLLGGSTEIVFNAVSEGDSETAARWLALRDYRVSTRFSRPGADATLAVSELATGASSPEDTLARVQADLLDTYQAQMFIALRDVDETHANGFKLRQAEEAGLAGGYFSILAQAYGAQAGEEALAQTQAQFGALVEAALTNTENFEQTRAQIDASLTGFRAAPLSDEELARRAGQLLRFTTLIPVEYARGVRNGVITNDIEIQEALSFHEGATAALTDLHSDLIQRDRDVTDQLTALFAQTLTQIREVVEPAELQATVDEINGLLAAIIPEEWQTSGASDIDVILSILNQTEQAAAQQDYVSAESSRLEAYAILELGSEQRLRGFAPQLAVEIESLFWQGTTDQTGLATLLASQAPIEEIKATVSALEVAFGDAQLVLGGNSAPEAVTGNAAVIVFREGLEAVLILASLLASLRTIEQRRYRRPLLMGAVLAFGATVITWWLATNLLTVLLPLGERLEAIVSLIAIGVLLLITNWFFHKAYWTGWMATFHQRKQKLVGGVVAITIGQSVGLILLGFTSIYREGFETVLFLQSLVLEAGTSVVLQGVALGLFGTAIVGVITFALQVRLPYKKMLIVTGVMIAAVLVTMVGHTVHTLQSVGWLPITAVQGLYLPFWVGQWFGLFSTWQGLILQVMAAVFVIGSYFLAEYQNKRHRQSRPAASVAPEAQHSVP